jgi:hypothetical protein
MAKLRSRRKHKGRRELGTFSAIPHAVQDSDNWCNASPNAIKLLLAIARSYNGNNNGDLCAAFSVMKKRGWSSQTTLDWGLKELQYYGLIEKTRQGDLTKKPSLYALSWQPIDDVGLKLELCNHSPVASGLWRKTVLPFNRKLVEKGKRPNRRKKVFDTQSK